MSLRLVHVELAEANAFTARVHRHHDPVSGHRFSIGAKTDGGGICGVAICARPLARGLPAAVHLEVTRLATDGTRNACSFLYGACARAADALGYAHILTYILASESGTSLRAVGWSIEVATGRARTWDVPSRRRERTRDLFGHETKTTFAEHEAKVRWGRWLRPEETS